MEVVITFRSEGCFLDIQLSNEIHEVDFNHAITPCTGSPPRAMGKGLPLLSWISVCGSIPNK